MKNEKLYKCPKCGVEYDRPEIRGAGFTFWNCPACGTEDGIHITPSIESILSEELAEIKLMEKTFCTLIIIYNGIEDIPKFKKYYPEFDKIGNRELIAQLSSNGGILKETISLIEADSIRREAEEYGIVVKINA